MGYYKLAKEMCKNASVGGHKRNYGLIAGVPDYQGKNWYIPGVTNERACMQMTYNFHCSIVCHSRNIDFCAMNY